MRRSNLRYLAAATLAVIALGACSSSSKEADPATTPTTGAPAATDAPTTTAVESTPTTRALIKTVKVAQTSLGVTVVGIDGMTLYQFANDTTPGESACNAGCDSLWPPVTVTGGASHSDDITGEIGTIERADGKDQVTLAGHPLYTFSGDKKAGDVNGQGVAGIWYAMTADGAKIDKD